MVKKSIQVYVNEEGKKAALELTKLEKEKHGTHIRQANVISEILIKHLNEIKKDS